MQALVFRGHEQLTLEELPDPRPGQGEVLLQVSACGICGSDLHGYLGHSPRRTRSIPLIMGHEFAGRILAVGPGVQRDLVEGERVVVQPQITCGRCRACISGRSNVCPNMAIIGIERHGAFADLVAVPADRVFRLPQGVSDLEASQVEALAVEVHLFRQLPSLSRTVAVLGAGSQGLLAVQLARLGGASQIIVTDMMPGRLALAEQFGATVTIRADQEDVVARIRSCTEGWGADVIVDAVGAPSIRQQGVAALAPGGTLGLVGLGVGETSLDFLPVVNKELQIRGSYCYTDDDFLRALELIATGQIRVREMMYEAALADGAAYFERLVRQPGDLIKVLLRPEAAS